VFTARYGISYYIKQITFTLWRVKKDCKCSVCSALWSVRHRVCKKWRVCLWHKYFRKRWQNVGSYLKEQSKEDVEKDQKLVCSDKNTHSTRLVCRNIGEATWGCGQEHEWTWGQRFVPPSWQCYTSLGTVWEFIVTKCGAGLESKPHPLVTRFCTQLLVALSKLDPHWNDQGFWTWKTASKMWCPCWKLFLNDSSMNVSSIAGLSVWLKRGGYFDGNLSLGDSSPLCSMYTSKE
jgi:hypothetical protein